MGELSMRLIHGDCLKVLPTLDAGSVDAVVTDPPYGLEFMGMEWDKLAGDWRTDISPDKTGRGSWFGDNGKAPRYHAGPKAQAWHRQWAFAVLRVLKPAGYLLAFGGTRTFHRLACALEDAGFEVRDCIMWLYGSGFPKSKGCLKPAYEPILLCRKPGPKVLPLGVDECWVPVDWANDPSKRGFGHGFHVDREKFNKRRNTYRDGGPNKSTWAPTAGRWPANVVHDGGEEVLEAFAAFGRKGSRDGTADNRHGEKVGYNGGFTRPEVPGAVYGDTGTAARFFYCAKASRRERGEGNTHPTVKPLALMAWLVKLVCPEGGTVLDPFAGSGTTLVACAQTGRNAVGIERDPAYHAIAERRVAAAAAELGLFREAGA